MGRKAKVYEPIIDTKIHTNWTSPKTNLFAGLLALKGALSSGGEYKLIRMRNEDCEYPIKVNVLINDFRSYKSTGASMYTAEEIENTSYFSEFKKYLMLNYKGVFGTQEAIDHYYATGELSADNFLGMGVSHLVKVSDMVEFFERLGKPSDIERVNFYKRQYITKEIANEKHFYENISLKNGHSETANKVFKHKLWVVAQYGKDYVGSKDGISLPFLIKILNVLTFPLKYIPRRSVLKMPDYTNVSYRIGDITNGFAVEFQIPKKFSFK